MLGATNIVGLIASEWSSIVYNTQMTDVHDWIRKR